MKEYNHIVKGLDPVADAFSGTVYSDVINMKNWNHIQFIILKGVGLTGTSTITVEACDDATPTNVKAIPFRYTAITSGDTEGTPTSAADTGFTTTAGSSQLYKVDVDADALASVGYGYIRLKAVEVVDSPVLGGIIAVLTEGKYKSAVPETAIV
jgi:type 1 glutamine amidotransferase